MNAVPTSRRGSMDINERNSTGHTALIAASCRGDSHAVRVFLASGAKVSLATASGATALHLSATGGHLAVVNALVDAGADLNLAMPGNKTTPLHQAAGTGHSEVVSVLVEAGADPDCRLLSGSTPLYNAAQNGHVGAVKVLLRALANPLLTTSYRSGSALVPLDVSARNGHSEWYSS